MQGRWALRYGQTYRITDEFPELTVYCIRYALEALTLAWDRANTDWICDEDGCAPFDRYQWRVYSGCEKKLMPTLAEYGKCRGSWYLVAIGQTDIERVSAEIGCSCTLMLDGRRAIGLVEYVLSGMAL